MSVPKTSTLRKKIDKVEKEIENSKPKYEREFNVKVELLKSIQSDLSVRVMELEQQMKKVMGRMGL